VSGDTSHDVARFSQFFIPSTPLTTLVPNTSIPDDNMTTLKTMIRTQRRHYNRDEERQDNEEEGRDDDAKERQGDDEERRDNNAAHARAADTRAQEFQPCRVGAIEAKVRAVKEGRRSGERGGEGERGR